MWCRESKSDPWDFWGYAENDADLAFNKETFFGPGRAAKYNGWELYVVETTFPK